VSAALALMLAAASTVGRASSASLPYYELGTIECLSGGQMRAYPPRIMRSVYDVNFRNPEIVKWSPDLQVWRGSRRWVNYDTSRPFYRALTTSNGFWQDPITGGWQAPNGLQIRWVAFFNLPAGTYRIKHWLYWQKLGNTYPIGGTRTCRFY
jgi:hypothetical protein